MAIAFTVKYTKRKSISIIVERDRSVIVRAPIGTSEDYIQQVVQQKERLIQKKIDHNQKYPFEKATKDFVSGESLLYLGQSYQLLVDESTQEGVIFENSFLIRKCSSPEANASLKQWYLDAAKKIIVPMAKAIAARIGVAYNSINILDLKYRWGSCTPKDNIHLNWRLIKAPVTVIEYVIVHELTHLLEANHTVAFWNRVTAQFPDYGKAKLWLRENGHELETDF
jgi:predicted metal-dependent hydrolase